MNKKIAAGVLGAAMAIAGVSSLALADGGTVSSPLTPTVVTVTETVPFSSFTNTGTGEYDYAVNCPSGYAYLGGDLEGTGLDSAGDQAVSISSLYGGYTNLVASANLQTWVIPADPTVSYKLVCLSIP